MGLGVRIVEDKTIKYNVEFHSLIFEANPVLCVCM